jgi:hypothetical protein
MDLNFKIIDNWTRANSNLNDTVNSKLNKYNQYIRTWLIEIEIKKKLIIKKKETKLGLLIDLF